MKKETILILKACIIVGDYICKLCTNQRNYTQRWVRGSNKASEIQLSVN